MKLPKTLLILFILIFCIQLVSSSQKIITVKETELVKLEVEAYDEDGDELFYTYTVPLDEHGEWQTDYGDEGEYTAIVTVSDGENIISGEVIIIVEAKNREPIISGLSDITAPEGSVIHISPEVEDYENDAIDMTISEPVGNDGVWQTNYDDEGVYVIIITASDGENTVTKDIEVVIENFDREPVFDNFYPMEDVTIKEGEDVLFSIWANDADGDLLIYEWKLDSRNLRISESEFLYVSDYDDAGEHIVEAVVSGGEKEVIKSWKVNVENVNRAPIITESQGDVTIKEGEIMKIKFSAVDPDGDDLKYKISEPIGNNKKWQADYDSAGIYNIIIEITDGVFEASESFILTVEDVNIAPVFEDLREISVNEGETIEFDIIANDPDNDDVEVIAGELPEGAVFSDGKFTYSPPYYTVIHQKNLLGKIIYGSRKRDVPAVFTATDGMLSTDKKIKIPVNDVNLAPVLNPIDDIAVSEGDKVIIEPSASDPDEDYLSYTFSWPVGSDGVWQTDYDDADTYTITVTASDRYLSDSKDVVIIVRNKNREPKLDVIKDMTVKEGDSLSFALSGSDEDEDELLFFAEHLPLGATFREGVFNWTPSYDVTSDFEEFVAEFSVTDGNSFAKQNITIRVEDTNRKPVITGASETIRKVYTGVPVIFSVEAEDDDGDNLSYSWEFGLMSGIEGHSEIKRTFSSSGKKIIKAVVSDGKDEVVTKFGVLVYEKKIIKKEPAKEVKKTAKKVEKSVAKKEPVKKEQVKKVVKKTEPVKKPVSVPKPKVYVIEG
ncbi:hypothetical protein KY317_02085 [Candidatus Woesearchaeota archaeon]|nr:hypothetical protein [Candidatus Woesearchaeota archaeon]